MVCAWPTLHLPPNQPFLSLDLCDQFTAVARWSNKVSTVFRFFQIFCLSRNPRPARPTQSAKGKGNWFIRPLLAAMESPVPSCDSCEQSDSKTDSMGSDLEVPREVVQNSESNAIYGKNGPSETVDASFCAIDRENSKSNDAEEGRSTRRPKCQFVISGLEKFFYWWVI